NGLTLRSRRGRCGRSWVRLSSTTVIRRPRRATRQDPHRGGERVAALAVVAEHVQRGGGGCRQRPLTRSSHPAGPTHPPSHGFMVTRTEAVHGDIRRVSRNSGGDHG